MLPLSSFPVQSALAPATKLGSVSTGSKGHDQVKRNDIGSALTAGLVVTVGQLLKRHGRCHASLQESVARPPRRRKRLRDLKVGQELRGIVKAMLASHALVDVGAEFDAVLHASKMAEGNKSPGDVVSEGMEVRVWVSGMRSEGYGTAEGNAWKIDAKLEVTMLDPKELRVCRLAGSQLMLALSADVSEFIALPSDALLAASVSRIEDYGIFLLVSPPSGGAPVQGFVHVSEMKEGFVHHPEDEVEMGQELTVRLLRVDRKFGRLRLSMKLPEVEGY
eukprot:s3579_g17.t1